MPWRCWWADAAVVGWRRCNHGVCSKLYSGCGRKVEGLGWPVEDHLVGKGLICRKCRLLGKEAMSHDIIAWHRGTCIFSAMPWGGCRIGYWVQQVRNGLGSLDHQFFGILEHWFDAVRVLAPSGPEATRWQNSQATMSDDSQTTSWHVETTIFHKIGRTLTPLSIKLRFAFEFQTLSPPNFLLRNKTSLEGSSFCTFHGCWFAGNCGTKKLLDYPNSSGVLCPSVPSTFGPGEDEPGGSRNGWSRRALACRRREGWQAPGGHWLELPTKSVEVCGWPWVQCFFLSSQTSPNETGCSAEDFLMSRLV